LKDGRRRCTRCRFDWKPERLPLRLNEKEWRQLLQWFVRGLTGRQIAQETAIERKRVLRALTLVRAAMAGQVFVPVAGAPSDVPRQPPVLGLSISEDGQAVADVLSDADAEAVREAVASDANLAELAAIRRLPYGAFVFRGRFIRVGPSPEPGTTSAFGMLESFWAYLQRRLRSKGGIRRERLGLYLAEYTWRYNRRALSMDDQVQELLVLLRRSPSRVKQLGLSPRDFAADRGGG
jgi:hypothetical protein